jgi:hypothetical protein
LVSSREIATPIQVVQRFGAVAHVIDLIGKVVGVERPERQLRVTRAIFHECALMNSRLSPLFDVVNPSMTASR